MVGPLSDFTLRRLDLLPSLAAQDADEAVHCVWLPARGSHDLVKVPPLACFINAMTSALLLMDVTTQPGQGEDMSTNTIGTEETP